MTTEEIISGNELIAEFMGIPKCDRCTEACGRYKFGSGMYYLPEGMEYHSSWDWLMPVVEKIDTDFCSDYEVIIFSSSCHIQSCIGGKQSFMGAGKKIDAVYQAIIEFINWYNSQNKTNGNTEG